MFGAPLSFIYANSSQTEAFLVVHCTRGTPVHSRPWGLRGVAHWGATQKKCGTQLSVELCSPRERLW